MKNERPRRFGLVGVMALLPALAIASTNACSGKIDGSDGTGSSIDAATDGRDVLQPFPKKDTGPPVVEESGVGGGDCITEAIDATTFPWSPPRVLPGSCSLEDLTALVAFVEKTDDPQKWKDGAWTTTETCRSCVFAPDGPTWSPLILNAAGQLAELNVGGCIAVASGKEACGKTYQQWRACYLEACSDGACGDFSQCVALANKKMCKKAFDAVPIACGGVEAAAAAETACDGEKYVFEGSIRALCIGLSDAGDGGGD